MTQYFTMAQNFSSSVDKNIDPRTGQFKPLIDIASLTGNNARGPMLSLSLRYDPQSDLNLGFGVGWSFALASFDKARSVLVHPNGGNWSVFSQPSGGEYTCRYQKMKDFKFLALPNGDYCILNSNGDAVVLDQNPQLVQGTPLCLPKTMFSAAGDKLWLNFENGFLKTIRDGDGTTGQNGSVLAAVDYSNAQAPKLTLFPGKSFAQTIDFTILNNYLTTISTQTADLGLMTWRFESLTNAENLNQVRIGAYGALLAVTYPTGLRESVVYDVASGFKVPGGSRTLPRINASTVDNGGGQPPVRKVYGYDPAEHNFLGYLSGVSSVSTTDDNLYRSTYNTYTYSVTETVLDDKGQPAFCYRYTYNKYHLMTEEAYLDSAQQAQRVTTYTFDPSIYQSTTVDQLPPWFQNPTAITVKYRSKDPATQTWLEKSYTRTRDYYKSTDGDGGWAGLLKSETFADNKQVVHEYYRADGAEDGCPLDPHAYPQDPSGWVAAHKKATEVFDVSGPRTSVNRVEYDYMSIAARTDASFPSGQFFAPSQSRLYSCGQYAARRRMTYVTDPASADFTRPASVAIDTILTEDFEGQTKGSVGSTGSHAFTYHAVSAQDGGVDQIVTQTVASGRENTISFEYHCKYRGLLLKLVDVYGNTHQFTYGNLGARTKEQINTYNPDFPASYNKQYEYAIDYAYGQDQRGGTSFNTIRSELSYGGVAYQGQKKWLDGSGRPVWADMGFQGDLANPAAQLSYRQASRVAYNYFGEADSAVTFDALPAISGDGAATADASVTRQYVYDAFRSLSGYAYPLTGAGKRVLSSTFNPQTVTTTVFDNAIENGVASTVDRVKRVFARAVLDPAGEEVYTSTTDFTIAGAVASVAEWVTDAESGAEFSYLDTYDNDYVGRPVTKTLADGASVRLAYDPRFLDPLVTKVSYVGSDGAEVTLQERSYDSRGLLEKRSLTGRDLTYGCYYSYGYDSYGRVVTASLVDTKTPANTTSWTYSYNDYVGGQLASIRTSDQRLQTFQYDGLGRVAGVVETAPSATPLAVSKTLDADGRVIAESYATTGFPYASVATDYSGVTSSVTAHTDANGLKTWHFYNDKMQVVRSVNEKMGVDYAYDAVGRIAAKTTAAMLSWNPATLSGQPDAASEQRTLYAYDPQTGDLRQITEQRNGAPTMVVAMSYRSDGLLVRRTYGPAGSGPRLRSESFAYDARKRLLNYTCEADASALVRDGDGDGVIAQAYSYDDVNNLRSIVTTYMDGGQSKTKTLSFSYRSDNPFLIHQISKDGEAPVTIDYDAFDRATNDDQGRSFAYDSLERIASVTRAGKSTRFVYDGANMLRQQIDADTQVARCFFHDGYEASAEFAMSPSRQKSGAISRLHSASGLVGQTGADGVFQALPTDTLGDLIFDDADSQHLSPGVTPFGDRYQPDESAPAYHGALYNEALGGYYLGGGYRLYNPRIARFNKPDSLPPYSAAGINPFAYAHNDPVNFFDPSGHTPQSRRGRGPNVGLLVVTSIAAVLATTAAVAALALPGGDVIDEAYVGMSRKAIRATRATMRTVGVVATAGSGGTAIAAVATRNSNPKASQDLVYASAALGAVALFCFVGGGIVTKRYYVKGERRLELAIPEGEQELPPALNGRMEPPAAVGVPEAPPPPPPGFGREGRLEVLRRGPNDLQECRYAAVPEVGEFVNNNPLAEEDADGVRRPRRAGAVRMRPYREHGPVQPVEPVPRRVRWQDQEPARPGPGDAGQARRPRQNMVGHDDILAALRQNERFIRMREELG